MKVIMKAENHYQILVFYLLHRFYSLWISYTIFLCVVHHTTSNKYWNNT